MSELSAIDLENQYVPRICQALSLDEAHSQAQIIAQHLFNNGRQGLKLFRSTMDSTDYQIQMSNDNRSSLLELLKEYFSELWHKCMFDWLDEYLRENHFNSKDEDYQRVLRRTAEYGSRFMKDCPVLSIILQLLFQFQDNIMISTHEFDNVWTISIMKGWSIYLNHSFNNIDLKLLEKYKNNSKNVLFLALREFFREPLGILFNESDINNEQHFDIGLDCLAEFGWEHGLKCNAFKNLIMHDKYLVLIEKWKQYAIIDKSALERQKIHSCINDSGKISLSTFVESGELLYDDQEWTKLLQPIVTEFSQSNDFSLLINNSLVFIIYLLKRQQDLTDFFKRFNETLSEIFLQLSVNTRFLSLRLMIHVLLMRSNRLVSNIIMKLLSKQNPVPLIVLFSDKQDISLIIPDIIDVWDYSLPILLSFGIGSSNGKSSLLNKLFMTKFERTVDSIYFQQTIDIDFGYNCQPRRPINIADVHGELDQILLKRIQSLFNGFIIQIDGKNFEQQLDKLMKVFDVLPENKYCLIIVRDTDRSTHNRYRSILQERGQQRVNNVKISIIPDHKDPKYESDIDSLRRKMFSDGPKLILNQSDFLKSELYHLLDTNKHNNHLEDISRLIEPLLNELIRASQNTNDAIKFYPVYKKFSEICCLRQKLANVKFYEAIHDDSIYSIRESFYLVEENLRQIGKDDSDSIFNYFNEICKSQDLLLTLNLLNNELEHQQNRLIAVDDLAGDISIEKRFSLEVLWRNAIACYPYRSKDNQNIIIDAYSKYIIAGYPFELIDGDNFYFPSDFLLKTLSIFSDKRILVISIIGPQNSGKSTLLNYMFGTSFDVRDGRCTRGIYGSFVKSNRKDFDYILLIDSEGLLSTERSDHEFDHRIVLFCLALSHLVIINTKGDIHKPINDILTFSADTMKMIGVSRLSQPKVHFILNDRADLNIERNYKVAINKMMKILVDLKLESIIHLKSDMFHALPSAFREDTLSDESELFTVLRTESRFIKHVQKLRETIINSGTNSMTCTQEHFIDTVQWLRYAVAIFDTLQKFPDLTNFRNINERREHHEMREWIQTKLEDLFSLNYRDNLIEEILKSTEEPMEIILTNEEEKILKTMNGEIEEQFIRLNISQSIRESSQQFLKAEINQIFIALKTLVKMSYEDAKIKQLIHNGEEKLRKLIEDTIKSGEEITHEDGLRQFENMFNIIVGEVQNQFESSNCLLQTFNFIYTNYNIYEREFLSNDATIYCEYFQWLKELNESQSSIDKIKKKIETKLIIHTYEHSRIEELEFQSNELHSFSFSTIENLKYLNKNQLIHYFKLQTTTTTQTQEAISIDAFQIKIRKLIIDQTSIINNEEIFQISNCFQILMERIENLCSLYQRFIDTNLIQRIVDVLNSTIKEINIELKPFYLVISRHFKSSLHTYAILFLTKLYYDQQQQHFQQTIEILNERRKDLQEFFHCVISNDSENDMKCAVNLVRQLKQQLLDEFSMTAQRIINNEIDRYQYVNKRWIQERCDELRSKNNQAWNIDYIRKPERIIDEYLYRLWGTIETQIDTVLANRKRFYGDTFLEFLKLVDGIRIAMATTDEAQITYINRHFKSDTETVPATDKDLNNKKCCMAQVLYAYLSGVRIPTNYSILDKTYFLQSNIHTFFSTLAQQKPRSIQLMHTIKALHSLYESIRINNFTDFIKALLQQKDQFLNEFYQVPGNFRAHDKQNTYVRFLDKIRGCQERCPCCGRPCDVDHKLVKSKPGTRNNKHACISGHALGAMNGYCTGNAREPLLIPCEYNLPEQRIVFGSKHQSWSKFKEEHDDWDFNPVRSTDELNRSHGKWLNIWNILGPDLCRENNINFVPIKTFHFNTNL